MHGVARRLRKERRDAAVVAGEGEGDGDGRNHLNLRADPERGSVRLWGTLVADDAARLQTAIEHTAKNELAAAAGEEMDPWDVRCGDALAMLASAHLGGVSRDRATINVHVNEEALATNAVSGEASMKPPFDYPVSAALLERLLCDCRTRLVIDAEDGSVVRYSDVDRPPPALEQAVYRRDVHCVVKGCRATHGEIHHIVWRSKGGPTVQSNLVFVCWRHHRIGTWHWLQGLEPEEQPSQLRAVDADHDAEPPRMIESNPVKVHREGNDLFVTSWQQRRSANVELPAERI